jgi:hypothetical protein
MPVQCTPPPPQANGVGFGKYQSLTEEPLLGDRILTQNIYSVAQLGGRLEGNVAYKGTY